MLSLKQVSINSFNENIVYLHKDCVSYQVEDIKALTKVEVHGGVKPIYCFLEVVTDAKIVKPGELGLNNEAFKFIGLPEGANVSLTVASRPPSLSAIKKKIAGSILSSGEYRSVMHNIYERRYSNMDIASFMVATASFMTTPEVLHMTEALIGDKVITWEDESIVVDHHCLGGVPGNKTDIIITAIVAAYGLPIPKTASKSLTSTAGVADTFSVLANVNLNEKTLKKCIKENRGAIASYYNLDIAEVNKIIHSVEKQIGIIPKEHIVSSILGIKIAAGVTHLLIDIPVGEKARVKNTNDAMRIRKMIEYVGDMLSLNVEAVITDGSEPIGNGIGPVLEARDIMKILRNKEDAPEDLKEKSLFLAGRILEFDPKLRGGQGYLAAKEILQSGRALEALNKIIHAQGKSPQPELGHLTRDVLASNDGIVEGIDNQRINNIGVWAGANKYPGSGIDLFKKVGDKVHKDDVLYRIHSSNSTDFAFANSAIEGYTGYDIK